MDPYVEYGSDFLSQVVAGETIGGWLIVLVAWALISTLLLIVRRILTHRFRQFAERTANRYDDIIATLVSETRALFLIAIGLYLAVWLFTDASEVLEWTGRVAFVIFLLQIVLWGNSLITLYVERYKEAKLETDASSVTSVQAMGFVGRLFLWSAIVLVALDTFGVDITALVAGLGIGGVAVALAVQNILADLFASLSIVLDKPFVVGDFLIVNEYLGTVEHVGLKTTRLRSLSGEQIVFANSDLLKSRVRNYKRMFERRVVFGIGVTYQTPYDKLQAIPVMLRNIVEAQDMVRFDRAHFKEFGNFSLNFEIVYYVLSSDYNLYMDIQQAINLAIFKQFEEAGIEFAYPTQTLFVEKLPEAATSTLNDGA